MQMKRNNNDSSKYKFCSLRSIDCSTIKKTTQEKKKKN